ncbi:MAG: NAD(+)/NADH kinase [Clostridia bacterium]|nr:NAD(+)/NADH kinase [Clostridia bacterium]MDY3784538.1 NAD(+)/NADH kinase [Eubacteriales bacterium]
MIRFALITNFNITEKANAALAVAEKLLQLGECKILFSNYSQDKITRLNRSRASYVYLPNDQLYKQADIIIVLGGDGTILESARRAAPYQKPLISFNLGRLGYMAELDVGESDKLSALFTGEYTTEKRSMLSVAIISDKTKQQRFSSYALNDAVISNGSISRIVDLELYYGNTLMSSYRSDGIIVATPTGSTAYSMSAGGPILDPALKCFCVTPICSHSLLSRPVVFPDNSVIGVKNISRRERSLFLTLDGKVNCEIFFGDVVRITKSDLHAEFIHLKDQIFYKTLRQKMSEYN